MLQQAAGTHIDSDMEKSHFKFPTMDLIESIDTNGN